MPRKDKEYTNITMLDGFDIGVAADGWFKAESTDGMRFFAQSLRGIKKKIAYAYAEKRVPKIFVLIKSRFRNGFSVGKLTGRRRVLNEKVQFEVRLGTGQFNTHWTDKIYVHPGKKEVAKLKKLMKEDNEARRRLKKAVDELDRFHIAEIYK